MMSSTPNYPVLYSLCIILLAVGCDNQTKTQKLSKDDSSVSKQIAEPIKATLAQPNKKTFVENRITSRLKSIFSKDFDMSIKLEDAYFINDKQGNKTLVLRFKIEWMTAYGKGQYTLGLPQREVVVYDSYESIFDHGREIVKMFPDIKKLIIKACDLVTERDKYGNPKGNKLEEVFTCCQTRDMALNLNVKQAKGSMIWSGLSSVRKYLDCTE